VTRTVRSDSFLTLHYRLAGPDGDDLVNTFNDKPATLSLGTGELAPAVEARLMGLSEGTRARFELAAGEAFGERRLADAGVADEHRVVLPPPAEDLERPVQLDGAAHEGIELPGRGALRQVGGIGGQWVRRGTGVLVALAPALAVLALADAYLWKKGAFDWE
jgi:hypothetical protein